MVHFTNAEQAYTGLQNESASTHLERSVCRDALVVLVDSQCLPVYLIWRPTGHQTYLLLQEDQEILDVSQLGRNSHCLP